MEIFFGPIGQAILKNVAFVLVFVMVAGTVMTLIVRDWMFALRDELSRNPADIVPIFGSVNMIGGELER